MVERVALITGGGQGLGQAFAECLLERNFKVALLDINVAIGNKTSASFNQRFGSGKTMFIRCDVQDVKQIEDAFDRVVRELGKIDLVVNNAGIGDENKWRRMIAINVNGVIDGTYTAVKHMRKDAGGKGGVIVNVASTAGLTAVPGGQVYAGTKHAVVGFSRSMAATCDIAGDKLGISVLCICPSYTDTEIIKSSRDPNKVSPLLPKEMANISEGLLKQVGIQKVSAVVDGFQRLIQDNVNGAVMTVTPGGARYRYPHKLRAAKL